MDSHVNGDSDHSSIITTSSRLAPSDSEQEGMDNGIADTQKYRLPEGERALMGSRLDISQNSSSDDSIPPTPPPKDFASRLQKQASFPLQDSDAERSGDYRSELDSYFNPYNLSRAGSVYTLSRVSLSSQLAQLTSIKLPNASSLSASIAAIPTSTAAARSLNDAAEQIRLWIRKAQEVLSGLNADDDVEWAAAGGRDGLGEVDAAITRFESLIGVYVVAIEDLQLRQDIASLSTTDLELIVDRMERILTDWQKIKDTLEGVKEQVEIAMEFEELWNSVLGEIGQELEALSRLVFEMEERRHRNTMMDDANGLDIKELETIVEEAPRPAPNQPANNRFSLAIPTGSPSQASAVPQSQEDSNLLALFARMQPLRASLDFLPMRLAGFLSRGKDAFPTGCSELQRRQYELEDKWKKLEADAESLRRELGEDRWVLVFRNAGRQAFKMCESVARSLAKLRDALDDGAQHTNLPATAKKIENYEAKKTHYGPAIERVMAIIDRGVKDRLTLNGEVLRLQSDIKKRWDDLQAEMKGMDFVLEELHMNKSQQLRDSISTILSSEGRSVNSSVIDTPGSSPASSVVLLSRKSSEQGMSTPNLRTKSRQGSFASSSTAHSAPGKGKRYSSLPSALQTSSHLPRKTPVSKISSSYSAYSRNFSSPTPSQGARSTASSVADSSRPDKPRWNSSTNLKDTALGHNFKPLSATTPSPYRRNSPSQRSPMTLSTPQSPALPSPLGRSTIPRPPSSLSQAAAQAAMAQHSPSTPAKNPAPRLQPRASASVLPRAPSAMAGSYAGRPPTGRKSSLPRPASRLNNTPGSVDMESLRISDSMESTPHAGPGAEQDMESPSARAKARPATALGGRRTSLLPQPKRSTSGIPAPSGRESRAGGARYSSLGGRIGQSGVDDKPRWRG